MTADLPVPSLTLAGQFEKDHERRYAHVPVEWARAFDLPAGPRYVRAQLGGANGDVRALTNPIWADRL